MPYSVLICNDCDILTLDGGPHGNEDTYCEGECTREDLFTIREVMEHVERASRDAFRQGLGAEPLA